MGRPSLGRLRPAKDLLPKIRSMGRSRRGLAVRLVAERSPPDFSGSSGRSMGSTKRASSQLTGNAGHGSRVVSCRRAQRK